MAAESDTNRDEAATPHKLSEARKRGQAAKSTDVVATVVFAAAVVYLCAEGWTTLRSQFMFDRFYFAQAAAIGSTPASLWYAVRVAVQQSLLLLAPFLITVMLAAIVGNVAQTGGLFSMHPITPDWSRLHPGSGLKRVFSLRTLFDALRACAKLVVLGWVVYVSLRTLLPQFYGLAGLAPVAQARLLIGDAAALGLKIAFAMALIAVIDLAYSRREFARRQRMSRRELKDEHKQREGDPRIRSRLRELRREMLKRTLALRRTREADVVVTNPTHYAVALRYRHGEMAAPRLIAKGAGSMAAAMRSIAGRHRIPVVENRSVARELYRATAIDSAIPQTLFPDVARIMVWVLAMQRARTTAAAPAGGAPT